MDIIEEAKIKEQKEKVNKFNQELKELLEKYNVGLQPILAATEHGILPQLKIVVLDVQESKSK